MPISARPGPGVTPGLSRATVSRKRPRAPRRSPAFALAETPELGAGRHLKRGPMTPTRFGVAVQDDVLAEHGRVAAETALPEAVREDDHVRRTRRASSAAKPRPRAGATPSRRRSSQVTMPMSRRDGPSPRGSR